MAKEIDCDGWTVRHAMDSAYQLGEGKGAPTRQEIHAGQARLIVKTPDGKEEEPIYYQEHDTATLRGRLAALGLDEDCVDRVFAMIGLSGASSEDSG